MSETFRRRLAAWGWAGLKTALQAFGGALVTGLGGGQVTAYLGHPVDWQAQLVFAVCAAAVAAASYLQKQPLPDLGE